MSQNMKQHPQNLFGKKNKNKKTEKHKKQEASRKATRVLPRPSVSMDPRYWSTHTVKCENNGVELAVYRFIPNNENTAATTSSSSTIESSSIMTSSHRPVVLLGAGCGNTVAVYTLAAEKSLPQYLSSLNCDVWAYDLRGHGKSKAPESTTQWNLNSYVFEDAVNAINFVRKETGEEEHGIHYVGHSMGGMIGMALAAHPRTTKLLKSVCALGSSIFLRNSLWWWVLYFTPVYPIFHLGGGIDMSTHMRNTNCLLQLPCVPSCGVYDSMVASSANAGPARVNKLLEECFCYEPTGVIDDLSEGMQADGLILRPPRQTTCLGTNRSIDIHPSHTNTIASKEQPVISTNRGMGSPMKPTPVLDDILGMNTSSSSSSSSPSKTNDGFIHRTFDSGSGSSSHSLPINRRSASEDNTSRNDGNNNDSNTAFTEGGEGEEEEELFYLKDHIGSRAPRILLVCATEDTVVPEVDVLATYEAIVRNSEQDRPKEQGDCLP